MYISLNYPEFDRVTSAFFYYISLICENKKCEILIEISTKFEWSAIKKVSRDSFWRTHQSRDQCDTVLFLSEMGVWANPLVKVSSDLGDIYKFLTQSK